MLPRRSLCLHVVTIALVATPLALRASAVISQEPTLNADEAAASLVLAAAQQGYLGVTVRDVDAAQAEKLKLSPATGAEVVSLDHDAPAAKAGLHSGDVIQTLNGQPVPDAATLGRLLRDMPVGKFVDLEIVHNGKPEKLHLQLADRQALVQHAWAHHFRVPVPEQAPMVQGFAAQHSYFNGSSGSSGESQGPQAYVGLQVEPLTAQLAKFFGVRAGTGLLVRTVEDHSPASDAGIEAGDVLLNASGSDLTSAADWMQMLRANAGRPMQVAVLRNRKVLRLVITVDARITQSELVMPQELEQLRQSLHQYAL